MSASTSSHPLEEKISSKRKKKINVGVSRTSRDGKYSVADKKGKAIIFVKWKNKTEVVNDASSSNFFIFLSVFSFFSPIDG